MKHVVNHAHAIVLWQQTCLWRPPLDRFFLFCNCRQSLSRCPNGRGSISSLSSCTTSRISCTFACGSSSPCGGGQSVFARPVKLGGCSSRFCACGCPMAMVQVSHVHLEVKHVKECLTDDYHRSLWQWESQMHTTHTMPCVGHQSSMLLHALLHGNLTHNAC